MQEEKGLTERAHFRRHLSIGNKFSNGLRNDILFIQFVGCHGRAVKGSGLKFCNLPNVGLNPDLGLVSHNTCVLEQGI